MAKIKFIKYSTTTKKSKSKTRTSGHALKRFQPRNFFHYFQQKHEYPDVTPIFLYCFNKADISFLDSETSTELNDMFCRSSRAKVSAQLELGRGQI